MVSERKVRKSFRRVKEDVEGVKNELAFVLRRIAKIEESMTKKAIEDIKSSPIISFNNYQDDLGRRVKIKSLKKSKKRLTWKQHVKKTQKKYPKKLFKEILKIASKSYKKK